MVLERAVEKDEKLESLKLESFHLSWKVPIEVGKFSIQYEVIKNFSSSARTFELYSFQFHFEFSNFSFFQLPFPTTGIPFAVLAAESSVTFQVRLIDDRDLRTETGRPEKILKI